MKEQEKRTNKKGYLDLLPEKLRIEPLEYPEFTTPQDHAAKVDISTQSIQIVIPNTTTINMIFGDVDRLTSIPQTNSKIKDADKATIFLKKGWPSLEPKQDSPLFKLVKTLFKKLRKTK